MELSHSSPVKVIWHPSSHNAAFAAQVLQRLVQLPGVSIEHPKDAADADKIIRELADSPGLLVAAGGDGTVHATVNTMMKCGSKRTLAVLPLGSGNDLARSLGMPFDAEAAVDVLTHGMVKPLDLVKFESADTSGWCANMITGGNTGKFLDQMTDEMKNRWGAFCYLRGVVDVIQNLEAFEVTIEADGHPAETFSALNVFLANGRTSGGGMVVSPEARLDDGLLEVVIVREGEPKLIADLTANYLWSDYRRHELIVFREARTIRLHASPLQPLTCDGDSIGFSPLDLEVCQGALSVQIPVSSRPGISAFGKAMLP